MPTPYDPAYIPGVNPTMPVAQPFAAGAGGVMPGTPGSMGLIPPMPQMAMPGLSPYGPAVPGTQSMMPAPVGGQWNQLAQQMAGPMFMPPSPSPGIPYPNPVMPGGGPIATVAAPPGAPPPVAMPVTSPVQIPQGVPLNQPTSVGGIPISHGGRVLAAGGGGGGGIAGMGVRSYSMPYTMHGVAQLPNDPVFGIDGSPAGAIPSPFGAGGGGNLPILTQHWAQQTA